MQISERILLALSRSPSDYDYVAGTGKWTIDNALRVLEAEFPGFETMVSGMRIADFGCGTGYQCIALVRKYNSKVVGIESNSQTRLRAQKLAASYEIATNRLYYVDHVTDDQRFDVIISQNSFEHFNDPLGILVKMRELVSDSGKILITFGPPWFSPYGSHMHHFCKCPWVNILFSERTVMSVRRQFRDDGACKYEEVEGGLNRMTVAKFNRLIRLSNLQVVSRRYGCIKELGALSKLPFLKELFINRVSVILMKCSSGDRV